MSPKRSALVLLRLWLERHTLNPTCQTLAPSSREQRPGAPRPRCRPVIEFPNFITLLANTRSMCWGTLPPPLRTPPSPGTGRGPRRPGRPRAALGPGSGQRGWALLHNLCTPSEVGSKPRATNLEHYLQRLPNISKQRFLKTQRRVIKALVGKVSMCSAIIKN